MQRHRNEVVDRYRRALVRSGFARYVATLRIGVLNPHFGHIAPA